MKIAIMQPYFLPYLGYFQLMAAADKFVLLDNVNFIKKGWINRNQLLLNAAPHMFTLPLQSASQNKFICDTLIMRDRQWIATLKKTIHHAYGKAPHYAATTQMLFPLLESDEISLNVFLADMLIAVARYVEIDTEIIRTARHFNCDGAVGQERIIRICKQCGGDHYVNAIGGMDLYDRHRFRDEDIELSFLASRVEPYPQGSPGSGLFVPNLSILDVLMFNAPEQIVPMLKQVDFK